MTEDLHKKLVQLTQDNNLLTYHLFHKENQLKIYEEEISQLKAQLAQAEGCKKEERLLTRLFRQIKRNIHIGTKGSLTTVAELSRPTYKKPAAAFRYQPLISIILAVPKGGEQWLRDVLASLQAQSYGRWELCVCTNDSGQSAKILQELAASEPRIKICPTDAGLGIAGMYNQALAIAGGEYIGVLEQEAFLTANALFEVVERLQDTEADLIYTDEAIINTSGEITQRVYRPDWSADMLLSYFYTGHFHLFRSVLIGQLGGFREKFPVSETYDFVLRFTGCTDKVCHIPKILYHYRQESAESKQVPSQVSKFAKQALTDALAERGIKAVVEDGLGFNLYRVRRVINGSPLVSIIIPSKDKVYFLQRCINSIIEKTSWNNYEIIIVDNNSTDPAALEYLRKVAANPRINVVQYRQPFSYSALNNWAVKFTRGSQLLFLNNDTEVIAPEWLTAMLEHAQRPEVGAVGAKLLGVDGKIQHAGVILGLNGLVDHGHRGFPGGSSGYGQSINVIRNYSAVTAACLMMRKAVFQQLGGFDEQNLPITFNDVDLCLRLRKLNYLIVYTPYAKLYHYESISRGYVNDSKEANYLRTRWQGIIRAGDPYYNPNLVLGGGGFYYIEG